MLWIKTLFTVEEIAHKCLIMYGTDFVMLFVLNFSHGLFQISNNLAGRFSFQLVEADPISRNWKTLLYQQLVK